MGKPKKDKSTDKKEILGKRVLCISMGGALYQCQNAKCLRVKKKGMFSEYNNTLFCGEDCIREHIASQS